MISCTDKGAKLSRALNLTGIGNDTIDVHTALGVINFIKMWELNENLDKQ